MRWRSVFTGAAQVDHQVRRGQGLGDGLVQLAVRLPVTLVDEALPVEVLGEDLGVLVEGAVLEGGAGRALELPWRRNLWVRKKICERKAHVFMSL
jgi:hypothetical protein